MRIRRTPRSHMCLNETDNTLPRNKMQPFAPNRPSSGERGARATLGARARGAAERWMAAALPPLVRRRTGTDALVLAFHNVVPRGEHPAGDRSLHLPQGAFAGYLDQLAATHDVVPLDELLRPPSATGDRPRAAVTFDDGYTGALTAGAAELAARGMPATFFVVPGLIDADGFWWDALAGEEGTLSEGFRDEALARARGEDAAVRDLARRRGIRAHPLPPHARPGSLAEIAAAAGVAGMRIGAHSWSHPSLARVSAAELRREVEAPLEWMRAHVPTAMVPWLSYPYGSTSAEVERAAARAGYAGAVRVGGGWVRGGTDPFAVPRVNVPAGLSPAGFALRAAGLLCR